MHGGKMIASGQIDRDLANEIILEARRQPGLLASLFQPTQRSSLRPY